MQNLTKVTSSLLGTTFLVLTLFVLSFSLNTSANTTMNLEEIFTKQNHRNSQSKDQWGRRKGGGENRGDEICEISPNLLDEDIWTTQPLFVWKGKIEKIEVFEISSDYSKKRIWTHILTLEEQTAQSILYGGLEKLKPGVSYRYKMYPDQNQDISDSDILSFTIMPEGEKRDSITSDLNKLDQENSNASPEERRQKRLEYFFDKDLFLDWVSYATISDIEELRNNICQEEENNSVLDPNSF